MSAGSATLKRPNLVADTPTVLPPGRKSDDPWPRKTAVTVPRQDGAEQSFLLDYAAFVLAQEAWYCQQ